MSLRVRPFAAFRMTSSVEPACGFSVSWRPPRCPIFGVPPSHRLKALTGDRKGQHSIRINDQWRVGFFWTEQGAMEIEITDYH